MSDSLPPHGLQPTRLLHPWDFPGKSTGVGCHRLLRRIQECGYWTQGGQRDHLRETYSDSVSTWDKASLDVFLGRRCSRPVQHRKKAKNTTRGWSLFFLQCASGALCWLVLPLPSRTEKIVFNPLLQSRE